MKFRYYMRGFGAGLIVAVIVLMIAGRIQKNNQDYAVVSGNKETEQSGSVIAYTTDASTEENTSSEKQTEESKTDIKETEKETEKEAAKETVTATQKQSEERTTTRPVVSVSSGNADGKTEIVFSGVYTAAQAADILYDAGIISDKTEFYTYMYTSGYDRKMKDGTYHLKAGDSYETIAKTITQSK